MEFWVWKMGEKAILAAMGVRLARKFAAQYRLGSVWRRVDFRIEYAAQHEFSPFNEKLHASVKCRIVVVMWRFKHLRN